MTELLMNPDDFNKKLMEDLVWFNTKRVHYAFKNKLSPVQFMLSLPVEQLMQTPQQLQPTPSSINVPRDRKSVV